MDKIEIHNGQATAEEKASRGKSSKQSLRFEKQTIRTLTGAELKLVGGGEVTETITQCRSAISFWIP